MMTKFHFPGLIDFKSICIGLWVISFFLVHKCFLRRKILLASHYYIAVSAAGAPWYYCYLCSKLPNITQLRFPLSPLKWVISHSLCILFVRRKSHSECFFARGSVSWNRFPHRCFPNCYNLNLFKSEVNHSSCISSYTAFTPISFYRHQPQSVIFNLSGTWILY